MIELWHISLVLHIIGISMIAGTTLADFVLFRHFTKQFTADRTRAFTIKETMDKLARIYPFGGSLMILSGLLILWSNNFGFASQFWFHIKMLLFIILLVNGNVFARKASMRITRSLGEGNSSSAVLQPLISRVGMILNIQMVILTIIFILSIFKFQ